MNTVFDRPPELRNPLVPAYKCKLRVTLSRGFALTRAVDRRQAIAKLETARLVVADDLTGDHCLVGTGRAALHLYAAFAHREEMLVVRRQAQADLVFAAAGHERRGSAGELRLVELIGPEQHSMFR